MRKILTERPTERPSSEAWITEQMARSNCKPNGTLMSAAEIAENPFNPNRP